MRERGATVFDRFVIERVLGRGASSDVYAARDATDGGLVALKILRDRAAAKGRFAREIALLRALEHPHVMPFLASGEGAAGEPWLAMPLYAGETLAARLARGPLPPSEAIELAARVLSALELLASRAIVHRDLKPSNLFLVDGAVAKVRLFDFGVARADDGAELTHAGDLVGTPAYFAPEMAGGQPVDARADVFSLGSLLFQALTGARPFEAEDELELLLKVTLEEAPRVRALRPEVDARLDDLVAAMHTRDPARRPDAAALGAVARALGRAAAEVNPAARTLRGRAVRLSERTAGFTLRERRMFSVVLARAASRRDQRRLGDAVAEDAGGLQASRLADGTFLLVSRRARDSAPLAARVALSLAAAVPEAKIVVAGVMGEVAEGSLLPAVDQPLLDAALRAARELEREGNGPWIAAELDAELAARFELARGPEGLRLVRERVDPAPRAATRSPCFGREDELARLLAELDAARFGARAVLLCGPPGIGKTRLARALVARAEDAFGALRVHALGGDPLAPNAALGLLAQLFRRAAQIVPASPADAQVEALRRFAAAAGAREEETLWLLGNVLGLAQHLAPPRTSTLSSLRTSEALLDVFTGWLARESGAAPTLLVLDDLQWADGASLRYVARAIELLREQHLLVLGLCRSGEEGAARRALGEPEELAPLKDPAARALVRAQLGQAASDAQVARAVERAAGNPLFLEELARSGGAGDDAGDVGAAVLNVLHERLQALPQPARRVLRAASVFGKAFWREAVHELVDAPGDEAGPVDLDRLLALLERAGLVDRDTGGHGALTSLQFRSALMRDAVYATLTAEDLRAGHAFAARWLARVGLADDATVALHHERAGETGEALDGWRRAAERALEAGEFTAAVEHAARCRALARALERDPLGEVELVAAEAARWLGNHGESEMFAAAAVAALGPGSASWYQAQGELALASGRLGHQDGLARAAAELGRVEPAAGDARAARQRTIAAARAGLHLITMGKSELADALWTVLDAARSDDDDEVAARVAQTSAFRALFQGRPYDYLLSMTTAAVYFERAGDRREAVIQRVNVGNASAQLGAFAEAEAALRSALAEATALRLPHVVSLAEHNLGAVLVRRGRSDDGVLLLARALAAFELQGDLRMTGLTRVYLSEAERLRGAHGPAIELARQACHELAATPPAQACALAVLANALLASSRAAGGAASDDGPTYPGGGGVARDEALARAREARALLDRLGGIEEGELLVRSVLVDALCECGEDGAAREEAIRARQLLLDKASKIADVAFRARFLADVEEHRVLVRRWSELVRDLAQA